MSKTTQKQNISDRLTLFAELIDSGSRSQIEQNLKTLHHAEIAHLIESLPREQRESVWPLLAADIQGEVLSHLNDEIRTTVIDNMDRQALLEITKGLEADDLADILPDLPDDVSKQLLLSMDDDHRQRFEAVMSHPEDTAGGLMNTDTITVRADISLDVVLRYLRFRGTIPDMTDNLIVINREGKYLGTLALTVLLTKAPNLMVADVISRDTEAIGVDMPAHNVASLFEKRDWVTAAVVDNNDRLVGRITIDDVVDVIREEADHSLMSMAGLSEEEDMFAPVVASSKRRTLWLGVNLITALLASWVISQFADTIERLVALAILMPVVASMGGIAGSQTLTLVIRGIALGQVSRSNAKRLLSKELLVGILNGLVWAVIVGCIAYVWFHDYQLGIIIAIAMLLNLIMAALAGASIPLLLHKIGIDPALAGGVLLTTITDVIGFLAFLGLAAVFII